MSIIAIFVGAAPKLSDIPVGCWAENAAGEKGWAVLSTKGDVTLPKVLPDPDFEAAKEALRESFRVGRVKFLATKFELSVTAATRREEVEKMAARFFNEAKQ